MRGHLEFLCGLNHHFGLLFSVEVRGSRGGCLHFQSILSVVLTSPEHKRRRRNIFFLLDKNFIFVPISRLLANQQIDSAFFLYTHGENSLYSLKDCDRTRTLCFLLQQLNNKSISHTRRLLGVERFSLRFPPQLPPLPNWLYQFVSYCLCLLFMFCVQSFCHVVSVNFSRCLVVFFGN